MGLLGSISSALGLSDSLNTGYGNAAGAISANLPKATGAISDALSKATSTLQPFTSFGASVIPSLENLMTNPSSVTQTPQYQFNLSEGLRGLTQGGSALGKYLSGQTLRGITNYASGMASNTYQQQFQNLSNLFGLSQTGATNLANMNMQAGTATAGLYTGAGQDLATLYASQGRDLASQNQMLFNTLAGIGQSFATGGYSAAGTPFGIGK